MKDWISLFEIYKIDRRLRDSYLRELHTLSSDSPRALTFSRTIEQLEKKLRYIEALLAEYDASPATPREAVRRSEERLFLTYHYIRGMSMEATAEEMKISRDTVYRIRRRIIARGTAPDIAPEVEWSPLLFPPAEESSGIFATASLRNPRF